MRDHKDAIRGLAQSQGTFDRPATPVDAGDGTIAASEVLFATAEPTVSGYGEATLVPQQMAAFERQEDERRAKGKSPTGKQKAKRRRTMRDKKEAEAAARAEAATEKAKERAREAASQNEKKRPPKTEDKPAAKKKTDPKNRDPDIDIDKFLDGDE